MPAYRQSGGPAVLEATHLPNAGNLLRAVAVRQSPCVGCYLAVLGDKRSDHGAIGLVGVSWQRP
jgi:hypothetical protein